MICPAKVSRSTIAAHSRMSVKVLVQPVNGSWQAIAIAERSSRSVSTWKRRSSYTFGSAMLNSAAPAQLRAETSESLRIMMPTEHVPIRWRRAHR